MTKHPKAMKVGQRTMCYCDPLTKKKPEGEVKLLKLLDTADHGSHYQEYWEVMFIEDRFKTARFFYLT